MRWTVISLGDRFRGDDGVGPLVLDELRRRYGEHLEGVENRGDMTQLLEDWRDRQVFLVDAVVAQDKSAGEILRLDGLTESVMQSVCTTSSHGLNLAEALELGHAVGALPERLNIYAICGENFATGAGLSPQVAASARRVAKEIGEHLQAQTGGPFCTSNP